MRPDKQKIVDEVWDDERVRSFLTKVGPDNGDSVDFHRLQTAYRSMRSEDFSRYLEFFVADGGDIAATDRRGRSLADRIRDHQQSGPFIAALTSAAETA